jgi:manganese/iron transport system permease protein
MPHFLTNPDFLQALLAATSMATACAVLSVFVVLRRWAFVGEGISHSGFGGAGTAWLLAALVPAFDKPWLPYVFVVVFCIATGLGIGRLSRSGQVSSDAAIGIFLVASLAWGFLAQQVYLQRRHMTPAGFDTLLFGQMQAISLRDALAACMLCGGVIATVVLLGKEILACTFDPLTARTSGVREGMIHYILMTLLAVTIVIGARVTGSVLVTALLVLPGATALLLSRELRSVFIIAVVTGLLGAAGGIIAQAAWPVLPAGPAIVLALFGLFLVALVVSRLRRD